MAVGENFGNEDPDDRALADGVGGDEGEDAGRDNGNMCGEKSPGSQAERGDVAERSDIEKSAAAKAVDQPESDKSEDEIGKADADGLQQCGLCPQAGEFEDARSEVENGVDA